MKPILIAYYTVHGSTAHLADAIARGVESVGVEAKVRQIPRVSDNLNAPAEGIPQSGPPYVELDDLVECSGLALGSPTRFGNMAAPVKYFLDQTSTQWLSGSLINKPAGVFCSSSSMHGGQESTLLSMQLPLMHHGMIICGLPYSEPALHTTLSGGTPYGATHVATDQNTQLSDAEYELAFAQGKRLATLAKALQEVAECVMNR